MPREQRPFLTIPDSTEVRLGIFLLIVSLFTLGPYIYSHSFPRTRHVNAPLIRATSEREIVRGDTSKKQLIFTFDGGDGNQSAPQILAALAKHHVKGTFFLTGKFIEANPDLVRRMVGAGNEIFSHTYDHPHLPELSDANISDEFSHMEKVLQTTAGVNAHPYFRAPYGDRDPRVLADAFKAGYQSVYWTVDALDWEETTGQTAAEVEDRILSNAAPGNIYLMHFGDTITGAILDDVFTKLEGQGYRMVSLSQGV